MIFIPEDLRRILKTTTKAVFSNTSENVHNFFNSNRLKSRKSSLNAICLNRSLTIRMKKGLKLS